ncbi:hypothetical protein OH76DRAFT_904899 [Lentinus brumalis]|uniref:Uncharacterized protein n=1 Tax=Lentinus brumalis TaxID=2498619 RepID=A0A371D0M5_9APHY|nr:hypothetical protein OH76DRAFT_904899 [Polyporus brumalis]
MALGVKLSYRHGLPLVLLYRSLTTVDSSVPYLDGTSTVSIAFSQLMERNVWMKSSHVESLDWPRDASKFLSFTTARLPTTRAHSPRKASNLIRIHRRTSAQEHHEDGRRRGTRSWSLLSSSVFAGRVCVVEQEEVGGTGPSMCLALRRRRRVLEQRESVQSGERCSKRWRH